MLPLEPLEGPFCVQYSYGKYGGQQTTAQARRPLIIERVSITYLSKLFGNCNTNTPESLVFRLRAEITILHQNFNVAPVKTAAHDPIAFAIAPVDLLLRRHTDELLGSMSNTWGDDDFDIATIKLSAENGAIVLGWRSLETEHYQRTANTNLSLCLCAYHVSPIEAIIADIDAIWHCLHLLLARNLLHWLSHIYMPREPKALERLWRRRSHPDS